MKENLQEDLMKLKSDGYKQLLLKQDRNNIVIYERRLDAAYAELEDILQPDVYGKIVKTTDKLLQAVISYTFDCFADLLAELDMEKEDGQGDEN